MGLRKNPKKKQIEGTGDKRSDRHVRQDANLPPGETLKPIHGLLGEFGRKFFALMVRHVEENKVKYAIDAGALTQFAFWMERWHELAVKFANNEASAVAVNTMTNGSVRAVVSLEFLALTKAEEVTNRYFKMFGVTPLARERMIAFLDTTGQDDTDDPVRAALKRFGLGPGAQPTA
jgi:hypothetical protein